jgi:PAS domain S-box-containing protein
MAVAGAVYLLWWEVVELALPGAFNPLGSRLAVVLFCWALFAASFVSTAVSRHAAAWFASCLWLITLHYFYLFHRNEADINWVVGSYITVIAACACLQTRLALLSYSAWVLALSLLLVIDDRMLLRTVFLPGILTILSFAYLGLRSRLGLLGHSQETAKWFQNLFDAVFEGIVVHDNGVIVDANESFATLFGYGVDEVIGMRVMDFIVPESRGVVSESVAHMSEVPYGALGRRKDGSSVPIEIRAKKHNVGGKTLRLTAISDISARKKGEQARVLYLASERAVRMRDEFLSVVSHELKTPLTNIKLQTQIAMRGFKRGDISALAPERVRNFIEQTDRQTDKLIRLVEEILDVSRISAGKLTIHKEELDLVNLVQEVISAFDASLKQAGGSLRFEGPHSSRIRADRFRMEQVVSNLLSNAIKYGNGKPIQIRLEQQPAETRLSVEDQGLGVAFEHQQRIFQRFERATSSRKISGLGLGLYISRQIVEAHEGRIEVASQPEQGARFTVVLPTRAEQRERE